jgi:phage shock protein PspC (stress-responsive transcriptional regulator)
VCQGLGCEFNLEPVCVRVCAVSLTWNQCGLCLGCEFNLEPVCVRVWAESLTWNLQSTNYECKPLGHDIRFGFVHRLQAVNITSERGTRGVATC